MSSESDPHEEHGLPKHATTKEHQQFQDEMHFVQGTHDPPQTQYQYHPNQAQYSPHLQYQAFCQYPPHYEQPFQPVPSCQFQGNYPLAQNFNPALFVPIHFNPEHGKMVVGYIPVVMDRPNYQSRNSQRRGNYRKHHNQRFVQPAAEKKRDQEQENDMGQDQNTSQGPEVATPSITSIEKTSYAKTAAKNIEKKDLVGNLKSPALAQISRESSEGSSSSDGSSSSVNLDISLIKLQISEPNEKPVDVPQALPQSKNVQSSSNSWEFQNVSKKKTFNISNASEKLKLAVETAQKQARLESWNLKKSSASKIAESSKDQQSTSSNSNDTKKTKKCRKLSKKEKKKPSSVSSSNDDEVFKEAAQYNMKKKIDEYLAYRASINVIPLQYFINDIIGFLEPTLVTCYSTVEYNEETISEKNKLCAQIISHVDATEKEYRVDVNDMKLFFQFIAGRNEQIFVADMITVNEKSFELQGKQDLDYFENYYMYICDISQASSLVL